MFGYYKIKFPEYSPAMADNIKVGMSPVWRDFGMDTHKQWSASGRSTPARLHVEPMSLSKWTEIRRSFLPPKALGQREFPINRASFHMIIHIGLLIRRMLIMVCTCRSWRTENSDSATCLWWSWREFVESLFWGVQYLYFCLWTDRVGKVVFDDGIWWGKGHHTTDLSEFVWEDVRSWG